MRGVVHEQHLPPPGQLALQAAGHDHVARPDDGHHAAAHLSGWTCTASDSVVTTPVHGGTYAAKAVYASSSDYARCSQTITGLTPGTAYTFRIWVQGSGTGVLGVTVNGSTTTQTVPNPTSWTQAGKAFTTGAGVTSATIYVETYGTDYFDDATVS